jgi:4-hydroxyphenylpyruvate 3-dimethylallyltransferase
MGGLRPFGEIIDVDDAPVGVMRHEQIFKDLNLNFVRHIAVDFHSNTVDLYFRASDPLSKQRALNFVDLVGHSRISESDYAEMEQ